MRNFRAKWQPPVGARPVLLLMMSFMSTVSFVLLPARTASILRPEDAVNPDATPPSNSHLPLTLARKRNESGSSTWKFSADFCCLHTPNFRLPFSIWFFRCVSEARIEPFIRISRPHVPTCQHPLGPSIVGPLFGVGTGFMIRNCCSGIRMIMPTRTAILTIVRNMFAERRAKELLSC